MDYSGFDLSITTLIAHDSEEIMKMKFKIKIFRSPSRLENTEVSSELTEAEGSGTRLLKVFKLELVCDERMLTPF